MWNIIKIFWESYCNIDSFISLIERLGWKEKAMTLFISAAASVATALSGQPWWVNILSFFGGAFIALVFIGIVKKSIERFGISTQIQAFLNKGSYELEIVYDPLDATAYTEVNKEEVGHGIHEGIWITQKIKIKNKSNFTIHGVQVQLTEIIPLPPLLYGRIPLFLKFHGHPKDNKITLSSGQEVLVNVVSYHNKFWNPYFHLEEAGFEKNNQIEIVALEMKDPLSFYLIKIQPMALNGKCKPQQFKLWLRDKNIMLQPFNPA